MADKQITKETQEKLMQLQVLQQQLQVLAAQKQQLQLQEIEVNNALKEISKTKAPVYSLVGGIMVEQSAVEANKELQNKKKEIDIRVKSIERQENRIKSNVEDLQKTIIKELG